MHILPMNKLSGAEKVALLICENIKEYEVVVVCGGEELKKIFEKRGIKTYSLSFLPRDIVKTTYNLSKIIKVERVNLIHAHDNLASIYGYILKNIFFNKVKVASHIHSAYPFLKNKSVSKLIDSYFRPRYDCNILCGQLVLDHYLKYTNYFREDKSHIASNSVDLSSIVGIKSKSSDYLKEYYNIGSNKKVIGFCGRLCEIKGLIPFINILAENIYKFKDCVFLIVGSGELENEIKSLVTELNLDEYFIFAGFKEDVLPFYSIMDIFFLPSLYEGLPMVLLEAMAFEKTVVSMNVGGISELIKNEKNGYLVEEKNYGEFINTLERAVNNYDKDYEIRNLALRTVHDKYEINSYCKQLSMLYTKILE